MMEQAWLMNASLVPLQISPADAQAAEPVQERDGLLEYPAVNAESEAVLDVALGEVGCDALPWTWSR
ncbi:hypothetical protein ABZS66_54695 [Dactylosporangium sp. NPDC005572]|uniref:hypothetical protein n=1 Tax=Dactylosporangium sp. NPDC005572 TaxID=3156889 RepID=UPI0033B1A791